MPSLRRGRPGSKAGVEADLVPVPVPGSGSSFPVRGGATTPERAYLEKDDVLNRSPAANLEPELGTNDMRTFKVTVSYDGTDFSGFQRQANARSVQAELEIALAAIEGKHVTVAGAGRTDAGVH